jgi:hypothetical protein
MKASSNLHLFLGNSNDVFKHAASELTLVLLTVKCNISYRCMDCTSKISKDIFHDSNLAKKMPYGRTKTEGILTHLVVVKIGSWTSFNKLMKQLMLPII